VRSLASLVSHRWDTKEARLLTASVGPVRVQENKQNEETHAAVFVRG